MSDNLFVRMSGLGGQGVVTAAHILGSAAIRSGRQSTVNPFFGAEKRLAPTESYVRISNERIHERGEILFPHFIMVFHPHVITLGKCYTMPFFDGLQPGGRILVNSETPLPLDEEHVERLLKLNARLFYVPATRIASEVGGTDLSTNLSMLGGLMGVVDLVSYDALRDSIQERFGGAKFIASGTTSALDDVLKSKYAQVAQLVEKNMEVIRAASTAVTEYDLNTKQEAEWTGGAATYVSAEVDLEKCNGCKICILTCPDPNVIEYVQDSKKVGINAYRCKGCGLCVTACPREALSISSV